MAKLLIKNGRVIDPASGVESARVLYRPVGESSWRHLQTQLQDGALRARVDSTRNPAGEYEFMAQVTDVAGNVAQTTTRANGQPALGAYVRTPTGRHATGLFVLTLSGDRISALTRFESSVLPWFGLPRSLPAEVD